MEYSGVVIADQHHGAIDDQRLLNEHEEVFFEYLEKKEDLNFIIIDGDFYDAKMYLNNKTVDYSIKCMDRILSIASKRKAKVRVVYGTESHDSDQYGIFNSYLYSGTVDFKIIRTVEEEELFPKFWVLYLPEEYMYDKKEYYKKYFSKKEFYDYVFGHGVIQEVMTDAVKHTDNKSNRARVPVFTTAELSKICKGQVFFGHYHIHTEIDDKIFYVGSFSRWRFGEEEPKGFFDLYCNTAKGKYKAKFIENFRAQIYKTISFGYNHPIFQDEKTLISQLGKMEELKNMGIFDYVRLVVNIPENYPNPEFVINFLKEKYGLNQYIKVNVVNGYIEKKKKIDSEQLKNVIDQYGYIFEKSMPFEEKLRLFIKERYGVDIDPERIKKRLLPKDGSVA